MMGFYFLFVFSSSSMAFRMSPLMKSAVEV